MRRFLILFLSLVIAITGIIGFAVTSFGASSVWYFYDNIYSRIHTASGGMNVWVDALNPSACVLRLFLSSNTSSAINTTTGTVMTDYLESFNNYQLHIDSMGFIPMSLTNLQDKYFSLNFKLNTSWSYTQPDLRVMYLWYNGDGTLLSTSYQDFLAEDAETSYIDEDCSLTCYLDKPSGATSVRIQLIVRFWYMWFPGTDYDDYDGSYRYFTFDVEYFNYYIPLTAYEVQEMEGELNNQFGPMIDKQEQTNQYLDDIVNGSVNPDMPNDSDKVGDLADMENNVSNSIDTGSVSGVMGDASSSIGDYGTSFLAVASLFNIFAELGEIKALLIISLGIGFVSVVLNLGVSVGRSRSHSQAKHQRAHQREKGGGST